MIEYSVVRKDRQQDISARNSTDAAVMRRGGPGGERTVCLCDAWEAEKIMKALRLYDKYAALSSDDQYAIAGLMGCRGEI